MRDIRQTLTTTLPWSTDGRQTMNAAQVAGVILRIAIVAHAAGVAVSLFSGAGSPLGSIALMQWGVSHEVIFLTERLVSAALLMLAVSLLFYPTTASLMLISAVVAIDAWATHDVGGEHYAEYALLTHSLRFMVPVAVIFLLQSERAPQDRRSTLIGAAAWTLRLGLATVFFMHGMEALWHHPSFIDLIIGSGLHLGISITEDSAVIALSIIGTVDVVVALMLLIRPWRPLLVWLCFWGLITALSRPIAMGFPSYPDVLVRASHFMAPVAIGLLWQFSKKKAGSHID